MSTINGKELNPFVMTWGQRKELKQLLARIWAKVEKLGSDLETAKSPEDYAKSIGEMAKSNDQIRDQLLLWAYKGQGLTQEDLDAVTKPSEIYTAAADFLEANLDPEEDQASKKLSELLRTVAR